MAEPHGHAHHAAHHAAHGAAHDAGHDDWAEDDPSAKATWYIGWVGAFLLVVSVAGFAGLYYAEERSSKRQILSSSAGDSAQVQLAVQQRKNLNANGQVDHPYEPGLKVKTLSIEKAMAEIVKEHAPR